MDARNAVPCNSTAKAWHIAMPSSRQASPLGTSMPPTGSHVIVCVRKAPDRRLDLRAGRLTDLRPRDLSPRTRPGSTRGGLIPLSRSMREMPDQDLDRPAELGSQHQRTPQADRGCRQAARARSCPCPARSAVTRACAGKHSPLGSNQWRLNGSLAGPVRGAVAGR